MRTLKNKREVIAFVNGLTPDEAAAIYRLLNSSPEVMRLLRAEGVVVRTVKKPHYDDDQPTERQHRRRKVKRTKRKQHGKGKGKGELRPLTMTEVLGLRM